MLELWELVHLKGWRPSGVNKEQSLAEQACRSAVGITEAANLLSPAGLEGGWSRRSLEQWVSKAGVTGLSSGRSESLELPGSEAKSQKVHTAAEENPLR